MSEAEPTDGDSFWMPSRLQALLGASALGVSLTDDPVGFVEAVVIRWILGTILAITGEVALVVRDTFVTIGAAFAAVGDALGVPFGVLGGQILVLIDGTIGILATVATSFGPFGPIVVIAIGGAVAIALLWAVSRTIRAILLVNPWT